MEECAKTWQAVAISCRGCGGHEVLQTGTCHRRDCPSCSDRSPAESRKKVADAFGAQPWTGEWVSTLPARPWPWCPQHQDETTEECLETCCGAHWRDRSMYHLGTWKEWTKRARRELDAHYEAHGLVAAYYLWPHTRGKRSKVLHPHLNLHIAGLAYNVQEDRLEELPGQYECNEHTRCPVKGPGHLKRGELESLKRALLRAARVPWSHRGKGPFYAHAVSPQQQAHRVRYIYRHPSDYDVGACHDPKHRVEDVPPRCHLLVPGGALVGRRNGAELKERYLELRPQLERDPGRTCSSCGEDTAGSDHVIFDVDGVVSVQVMDDDIRRHPVGEGFVALPRGPPTTQDEETLRIREALRQDKARERNVQKRRAARRDYEFTVELEERLRDREHTRRRLERQGIDWRAHEAEREARRLEEQRASAVRAGEELKAETDRLDREWEETLQRRRAGQAGQAGETGEDGHEP